ncbi:MAG: hypothetical protein COA84_13505 [Robiginitomaculum sp.]|nr:MAG: hypothetical protein COA84_13505 [Robiginitomaculum sp.]
MTHTVHVFSNSKKEVYIAVRMNSAWQSNVIASLTKHAMNCDLAVFMKDSNLNAFMLENQDDIAYETYPYMGVVHKDRSRVEEIVKYIDMGYTKFERDDSEATKIAQKRVKINDKPAATNFSQVLKMITDKTSWSKYYGTETLMKARASLTVSEMISAFPWPLKRVHND